MNTCVVTFFHNRYRDIIKSKLSRGSRSERLSVLLRDILMAYQDSPENRPDALIMEIEMQIC